MFLFLSQVPPLRHVDYSKIPLDQGAICITLPSRSAWFSFLPFPSISPSLINNVLFVMEEEEERRRKESKKERERKECKKKKGKKVGITNFATHLPHKRLRYERSKILAICWVNPAPIGSRLERRAGLADWKEGRRGLRSE